MCIRSARRRRRVCRATVTVVALTRIAALGSRHGRDHRLLFQNSGLRFKHLMRGRLISIACRTTPPGRRAANGRRRDQQSYRSGSAARPRPASTLSPLLCAGGCNSPTNALLASCVMEMGSTVHVRRTCSVQRCAVQRTPFATWRHEISSESARATSDLACGCRACAGVRIRGVGGGGETRGWRRACEAIARLNPIFGVPPPCAGATASSSLGGERARFFGGKATTSGSANGEVGPRGGGRGGAGGVLSVAQKLASASRSASVTSGRGPRRAWSGVEGEVGVSREARGG